MTKEQITEYDFERWRKHPDVFVEEIFGIKLMPYQKFVLRHCFSEHKRLVIIK